MGAPSFASSRKRELAIIAWLDRISEVTTETALLAAKAVLEGKHHVTAELLAKPQS